MGNASRSAKTTMFGEEVGRGGERKVVGGRWNSYRDLILYIAGEDERRARKRGKEKERSTYVRAGTFNRTRGCTCGVHLYMHLVVRRTKSPVYLNPSGRTIAQSHARAR